jgi:hypothetical protein
MSAIVEIVRLADGAVRRMPLAKASGLDWTEEGSDYMWSEGNYACDCNRALFFARAAGEPDPDRPCGDSAFGVRILVDGRIVFESRVEPRKPDGIVWSTKAPCQARVVPECPQLAVLRRTDVETGEQFELCAGHEGMHERAGRRWVPLPP